MIMHPSEERDPYCGCNHVLYEPVGEKTSNLGSDQVQHKPGCTVTEAGQKFEILDLRRRGIVLSV